MESDSPAEARQAFERLLGEHPDTPHQDRALYSLAVCAVRRQDRGEAVRLLDLLDRSFPDSGQARKGADLRKELE